MTPLRVVGLVAALLMVLAGGLWTFQGLGYLDAGGITGDDTWAVIGPIVAGLGVALGIVIVQGARQR